MNEYNFKDRTAVITGGAQGFGFAISIKKQFKLHKKKSILKI